MKRTTYTFVRKYSEAFVIMKDGPGTQVHYHKATLDRFAERRERFKKEKS